MNTPPYATEPCRECHNFANRPVTIDAVIVRDGKLLITKRRHAPFEGWWAIVGGHVDWNETVEQAVVREVQEETGLTVESARFLGVYSAPERHPKQAINIAYIVEASGTPAAADDSLELKWADLTNLPKLAFDHDQVVADLRAQL